MRSETVSTQDLKKLAGPLFVRRSRRIGERGSLSPGFSAIVEFRSGYALGVVGGVFSKVGEWCDLVDPVDG